MNEIKKNLPEKKFKAGAISATIWKNASQDSEGVEKEYRTISFERVYKDKEDNWKTTNQLRVSDIPKATLVLNKAYEFSVLSNTEEKLL